MERLRLVRDYPREPLLAAVREAARYGLYNLDRLERMILRRRKGRRHLLGAGHSSGARALARTAGRRPGVAHPARQPARALVAGNLPFARLDVLLIDKFGYLTLKPEQSNIFFKLMEERYHCHSTIITTNLVYDEWHNFLGNKSMLDALLSRAQRAPRHYCHTVTIDGPSLRELQG